MATATVDYSGFQEAAVAAERAEPTPDVRGLHPPRRRQGRETLHRIIDATEHLLDGRDFARIPITEICAEARVSESSFYHRFESKEALIRALHDRHVRRRLQLVARLAADVQWDELELPAVVRECLRIYMEDRVRHQPLLRSLNLAQTGDRSMLDQRWRLDLDALSIVEAYMVRRLGRDTPQLRRRIRFATRCACASIHDAISSPHAFADPLQLSRDEVVDGVAEQWMLYVEAGLSGVD